MKFEDHSILQQICNSRLNNLGVVTGTAPKTSGAGGPNSFIRGLASETALRFDTTFSDDLRNFLDSESPESKKEIFLSLKNIN